ncbi:Oxidative stress-induced growth inhibitor 2 [Podila epigama]|nr:Oxidative stress-induced growth inhibitor 2 [Podila epigama]
MFDSLAHPYLDTYRGEYPSFLAWKHSSSSATTSARSHVVLGRGDVGGIWADMEHDHNQTLSYSEHMELPLYSFSDFLRDHPEHDHKLDRPLRSTVSAYYKEYVRQTGIQSNFSNFTTVTAIHHLKDLEGHCCCYLDPQLSSLDSLDAMHCPRCRPYRYAVLGHIDHSTAQGTGQTSRKKTKFLVRCKTIVLSTGTFDQPKKLAAVSANPCEPTPVPAPMIQQTFHDCRQLEAWMARHNGERENALSSRPISPPPSPLPYMTLTSGDKTVVSAAQLQATAGGSDKTGPIIIVGTGLSAADAIILIQETQPWRRIIHIYRHYTALEPSPLKRCHRDVYPEYNSVWMKMKRSANLRNPVQVCQNTTTTTGSSFFEESSNCAACKLIQEEQRERLKNMSDQKPRRLPLCSNCSYRGLPDASIASYDPLTGEAVLVLSHGGAVKEQVAAVGVFIGKQVHMGFLKGSLAQEMLSTSTGPAVTMPPLGLHSRFGAGRRGQRRRHRRERRDSDPIIGVDDDALSTADILTPPCTPPRSPVLKPELQEQKKQFWQRQALKCAQVLCRRTFLGQRQQGNDAAAAATRKEPSESDVQVKKEQAAEETCGTTRCSSDGKEDENSDGDEDGDEDEEEPLQQSQVLTLLRPLVSDLYSFRIIPTGVSSSPLNSSDAEPRGLGLASSTSVFPFVETTSWPKKCTRLPCYPVRHPSESKQCSKDAKESTESTTESSKTNVDIAPLSLDKSSSASSCISMPCSPLLGSRRVICPSLSIPPLLALCASAASASIAAAVSTVCQPAGRKISTAEKGENSSSTQSSACSSSVVTPSSSQCSSLRTSASSSATSLLLTAPVSVLKQEEDDVQAAITIQTVESASNGLTQVCCLENNVCCEQPSTADENNAPEALKRKSEDAADLMSPLLVDQSLYAAGAITGSKFVRYILGNSVAIVADIVQSERLQQQQQLLQ